MKAAITSRLWSPCWLAPVLVGLVFGGLLVGYEPVGGDPDRIFRPIKQELVRAVREARPPYWSDRLGLGVPLVAESHVAAFYPPNAPLYGLLGVSWAYRLSMWLHFVIVAGATSAYARRLGVGPWGAALAGVAFSLCGFLTVHSSHEWAYHTLAYLPLCLIAADAHATTGRAGWLALLALLWGAQLALGHFQVQMWTAGLSLLTGGWRVLVGRRPVLRIAGLCLGLAWGGAVAAVQLVPSWELARLVGQTRRSFAELAYYSYPPAHWAELAVGGLFRGLNGGPEAPYWFEQQTTGFEACLFVGTVPLILACVGLVGGGKALAPWRLIVPASFALATMPRWWPQGYALVLQLPGLGYFRCPARYTAVTSFGLALLAGHGLDRTIGPGRFRAGLAIAVVVGVGAIGWAIAWPVLHPSFQACLDGKGLAARLGLAALTWAVALAALMRWRRGTGARALFLLLFTTVELAAFFHGWGTTRWGWSVPLPEASPVLTRLAAGPGVRRVGGTLDNLPVRAGLATATPYTGFPMLPPNPMLKSIQERPGPFDPAALRWLRRFGVTHLVHFGPPAAAGLSESVVSDPALDLLVYQAAGRPLRRAWRVAVLPSPFPPARAALRAVEAPDRASLLLALSSRDAADEAWFLPGEAPPPARSPRAHSARVVRWDGLNGEVEHDGACDLVVDRGFYPGWVARVDGQPPRPVAQADGGLIAVRLDGSGTSRLSLSYQPNGRTASVIASLVSIVAALVTAAFSWRRGIR